MTTKPKTRLVNGERVKLTVPEIAAKEAEWKQAAEVARPHAIDLRMAHDPALAALVEVAAAQAGVSVPAMLEDMKARMARAAET